jgi:hypothetical protein
MADNIPTPGGAVPPKPAEASKVQPKKETVRINLPPKPTSAPTIKLPTLAPGAPAPSSSAAAPVAVAAVAAPAPAKAPAAPAAAAPAKVGGPATTAKPAAPAPAPRPVSAPAFSGLTGLDKGLAIAAMVASLAALGCVIYIAFVLKDPAAM